MKYMFVYNRVPTYIQNPNLLLKTENASKVSITYLCTFYLLLNRQIKIKFTERQAETIYYNIIHIRFNTTTVRSWYNTKYFSVL